MKSIEERFDHFNTRLRERYGFEISMEKWKSLTIKQGFYRTSNRSLLCTFDIDGREIIGIMQVRKNDDPTEKNYMRTALPSTLTIGQYPLPHEIKKEMRRSVFGELCKQHLNFALKLNLDARELFAKYPSYIAHRAKYKHLSGYYSDAKFTKSVAIELFPGLFLKKGKVNS